MLVNTSKQHRILWILAVVCIIVVLLALALVLRLDRPDPAAPIVSSAVKQFASQRQTPAPRGPVYPANVLNLVNWYLTLPVGCTTSLPCSSSNDTAAEVMQPRLQTFTDQYFQVTPTQNAVAFRAYVNGTTTTDSSYPRSELREMTANGGTPASWSSTSGVHVMAVTEAVTHLPTIKAQAVTAQIHNDARDIVEVVADGPGVGRLGLNQYRICVRFGPNNDKETGPCLDSHYTLGTFYTIIIEAAYSKVKVWYANSTTPPNTSHNPTWQESYQGGGNYFKAGVYTQSNLQQGDKAGAYGEVLIRNLLVTHS